MAKPRDGREYVRLSVTLPSHPKLARIDDPRAGWLYTVGLCHAGEHLTDGLLTPGVVQRIAGVPARWTERLIGEGLWHKPGHSCPTCPQPPAGQVIVHDYLEHQRSRAEADELRAKRSEAGSRGAAGRWQPDSKSHGKPHSKRDGKTMAEVEEEEELPPDGGSSDDSARADVEAICQHLANRIEANGSRRPTIGKTWRNAARLLLDHDQRTEQQVHVAIDWCQDHAFWRSVVLSMPKLREKYEQLRLQATREATPRSTADERAAQGLALVAKYEAEEAAAAAAITTRPTLAIGGAS